MLAQLGGAAGVGKMRLLAVARNGAWILQIAAQLRMVDGSETPTRGEMRIVEILLGTTNR